MSVSRLSVYVHVCHYICSLYSSSAIITEWIACTVIATATALRMNMYNKESLVLLIVILTAYTHLYVLCSRYGKTKWSFAPKKSVEGSVAFTVGSFLSSCVLLQWLMYNHSLLLPIDLSNIQNIAILLLISVICALVELIPVLDDNITVPVVAAVLAKLLLPN